jgi:hypothetical protein
MKVFADGVMYGLPKTFASKPGQSVSSVGQPGKVPYQDFLHYTLSAPGVATLITGIGLIDKGNEPARDQLLANLQACQITESMQSSKRRQVEEATASLHGTDTNFFQRTSVGMQPPQTVKVEREAAGGVAVKWSTAFAAGDPLVRYEIYKRGEKLGEVPFTPQVSEDLFSFRDPTSSGSPGGLWYHVRAVDAAGRHVDSISAKAV